jgi:hypothetical protein
MTTTRTVSPGLAIRPTIAFDLLLLSVTSAEPTTSTAINISDGCCRFQFQSSRSPDESYDPWIHSRSAQRGVASALGLRIAYQSFQNPIMVLTTNKRDGFFSVETPHFYDALHQP